MPLNLAEINQQYTVQKICGDEEQRHYLETLGFVENGATEKGMSFVLKLI